VALDERHIAIELITKACIFIQGNISIADDAFDEQISFSKLTQITQPILKGVLFIVHNYYN